MLQLKTAGHGLLAIFIMMAAMAGVRAEPYLAAYEGLQCSACHVSPAGGGMRSAYGNVYAQNQLAARRIGNADDPPWNGEISQWLAVGANLRAGYSYVDTPNEKSASGFDVNRGTFYAEARIIPQRLSVYVDQQFAPGASINREAYLRLSTQTRKMYLVAGQFFLPYGLRIQDDSSFIRQVSGVNFFNPDRGIMLGYESGPWSTMLSVTNGNGGTVDNDSGKQVGLVASYARSTWRVGTSINYNDADAGDRQMQNIFATLRTGPVAWLAEFDLIRDDLPASGTTNDASAALVEGNWLFRRGHNLKVSYDYYDPNRDVPEDHRVRWSLLWEYTPVQFVQFRLGLRAWDGIPQSNSQNRDEAFAELHGYF